MTAAKKDSGPSVSARVEADGAVTVGVEVDGVFVPVGGATAEKVTQAKYQAEQDAQASGDDNGKEG